MRMNPGWRALTWGLLALMLVNACATVPLEGTGGSSRWVEQRGPRPGSSEWRDLEEARRAEIESALAGMWGVASEVRDVGSELEFTFWAEGGALTLLSLRRLERGHEPGSALSRESFARELVESLSTYADEAAGEMRLTLRREERRWRADFQVNTEAEVPLEAKTWPVRQAGVRAEVLERLVATGREVAGRVWVPAGAQVRWQVEVELEDERVRSLDTHPPRILPGGKAVKAAPETVGTWVNVLAPFTQGLGPRKVRMEWEGTHVAGSGLSRWKIVAAEVVRPPPPAPQNAEVALEYRAMHEQIQRQWREQTRETFEYAGLWSAEQVALFVVAGWAARGLAVGMEAALPMVSRVLAKGGTYSVGWLRSLLARASSIERQTLGKLMMKAETQGVEALSVVERNELKAIFSRLETLTKTPLQELGEAKSMLRREARELFYQRYHPELAALLRSARGVPYDVHHCVPLEYAHLFPLRDINAELNLVAAAKPVHQAMGNAWTRFRMAARAPSSEEVLKVEEIVRKHFGRWFNQVYDGSVASAERLSTAEAAAIDEVNALLTGML